MKQLVVIAVIGAVLTGCATQDKSVSQVATKKIQQEQLDKQATEIAQHNLKQKIATLKASENMKCDGHEVLELKNNHFIKDFNLYYSHQNIAKHQPIISNGKVLCQVSFDYTAKEGSYPVNLIEKGYLQGSQYQLHYRDLSGSIGGDGREIDLAMWSFSCDKNVAGEKECYIINYETPVYIYKNKQGYLLQIGSAHAADSTASITINGNNALISKVDSGFFDYSQSKQIIQSIKSTDKVFTKHIKQNAQEITTELNVTELKPALNMLDIIFNEFK